ncbi:hypothetical protein TKK_0012980 [Trichogramma kaykai]
MKALLFYQKFIKVLIPRLVLSVLSICKLCNIKPKKKYLKALDPETKRKRLALKKAKANLKHQLEKLKTTYESDVQLLASELPPISQIINKIYESKALV